MALEMVAMPKQKGFSKANSLLKKLPTKKKTANDKKALLSYLSGEYGITYFNKVFIYKLDHINEGTLQNLQVPIFFNTLLEMFMYYKNDLEKWRVYNKKIGRTFSDKQGVLNYDLAIILGKHSDYLLAMEEEKSQETKPSISQSTVKLVSHISATNNVPNKEVSINDMLEDW